PGRGRSGTVGECVRDGGTAGGGDSGGGDGRSGSETTVGLISTLRISGVGVDVLSGIGPSVCFGSAATIGAVAGSASIAITRGSVVSSSSGRSTTGVRSA